MTRYWFVGLNALVLLLMAFSPWAVPNRSFDGAGVLLTPFGTINPQELSLPSISSAWVGLGFWLAVILLIASTVGLLLPNPQNRARLFYLLGGVGLALFVLEAIWFYQSVRAINDAALAQGVSARRLPLKRYALSLGSYLTLFYSIGLLLLARMQLPGGKAFLVRYRGVVVPLVSLLIAVLFGAVVVAFLKEGLGTQGKTLGLATLISTKLDLVTYTYQLLFSPIITLPGIFQSLLLATPLIFTGLAVAFGFQAGLFNIGAPGQLTVGAIGAMLVGVYMPGPAWMVFPLAIAAAAAGGALWGAIPGWLKARFGANEVINTIMMNYIAASLFLFLISSNQYKFFGQTVRLPFKAQGFEAKSEEIQAGARIPLMINLLVENGHLSFALPLAAIGAIAVYFAMRRLDLGRRLLAAAAAMVAGFVIGGFIPGPALQVSPALASVRFNGSFLIAILALLFYNFYLYRTSSGYEMRAFGLSPKAAEYAGVNLRRKMVAALSISGALAGLASTHYVLGSGIDEYRLKQSLPASVGFDGIPVALMGQNTPIGIFLSALLFGVLLTGGLQLNLQLAISRELVSILQALVVLLVAIGGFLPRYFTDPLRAAQIETEAKAEQEARDKALAGGR
jgi:simple sugar transport system permease protein